MIDVLLTDKELTQIAEEFKKLYPTSSDMILWRNFRLKKQCLKLLDVLKEKGELDHDYTDSEGYYCDKHSPNCFLCELEKLLKES